MGHIMDGLLNFFSREAGQQRRKWLDDKSREVGEAIQYMAGPGANVGNIAGLLDMLNPVSDVGRAQASSQEMVSPGKSATERLGLLGSMLTDVASVAAPGVGAGILNRMGGNAAQAGSSAAGGVIDSLLGFNPGAGSAIADDLASRATQRGPVPTMYSNPVGSAPTTSKAQGIADMLRSGRGSDVTDDMLAALTPNDNMELFDLYKRGATGMYMPMDEASRMARARDMGFDTGTPLYHGTGADFAAFDLSKAGKTDEGFLGRGVYSTNAPDLAEEYGGSILGHLRRSPTDLITDHGQAKITSGNAYDDIEAMFGLSGPRDRTGQKSVELSQRAQDAGYSGITVNDELAGVPASEMVTFDPRNIRSRFARFDPRLSHLSNLSAGVGGLGLLGAFGSQPPQDDVESYLKSIGAI